MPNIVIDWNCRDAKETIAIATAYPMRSDIISK